MFVRRKWIADACKVFRLAERGGEVGGTRYRPERRFVMSEDAAKTPFKTRSPKASETRETVVGRALAKSAG